jgi:hypothetical protein
MLTGQRFKLKSPSVAVNDQLVVLTLPVGSILTLISDTVPENRMVEVMWNDHKLTMFRSDLTAQGAGTLGPERSEPASLDSREIRQRLEADFHVTELPRC